MDTATSDGGTAPTGMVFKMGGTEIMRLTATGAAVGTDTPASWATLDVNGSIKGNVPYTSTASTTTTVSLTPTRGEWFDSGYTVTVPQDGTYFISFNARLHNYSTLDSWWRARVYNETTSTILSLVFGGLLVGASTGGMGDSSVSSSNVFSLSASDVLSLQYYIVGTGTSSVLINDTGGTSGITIFRLGD